MRWDDERYVRVYTRDTTDWVAMTWEARAVFIFLLRAADRAGIIPLGKRGLKGLAQMLHMPVDVLERAIMELGEDGCITCDGAQVVIRNFISAQEVPISDAQRKRDQRERDRSRALLSSGERLVVSPVVPSGHEVTQPVTPNRAFPNLAVPNRAEPTKPAAPAKVAPRPDPFPSKPDVIPTPPPTPEDSWGPFDFFRWAQWKRFKAKLLPEKPMYPPRLEEWWSEVRALDVQVGRLKAGFVTFGDDQHWQKADPPLPFAGFISQWRKYIPQGPSHAA